MRYASAFLASAFAALAALAATGATNGIDRWAIDHAMPGAHFGVHKPSAAQALVPLLHVRWHGAVHVLAEIVTVPAAFLPSLLLLVVLRRFAWIVPLAAGTAIEEICKLTLTPAGALSPRAPSRRVRQLVSERPHDPSGHSRGGVARGPAVGGRGDRPARARRLPRADRHRRRTVARRVAARASA